jgi:hypothetical protein
MTYKNDFLNLKLVLLSQNSSKFRQYLVTRLESDYHWLVASCSFPLSID